MFNLVPYEARTVGKLGGWHPTGMLSCYYKKVQVECLNSTKARKYTIITLQMILIYYVKGQYTPFHWAEDV